MLLLACEPPAVERDAPGDAPADAPSPASAPPTTEEAPEEAEDADEQGPWIGAERDAEHPDERIAARHILISWKGAMRSSGVTRDREEARALALDVRARLAQGEDFAALARASSDDRGTARRGGALGAFGRGVMQKEFEDAAFALAPNTLSGLVETPFGFHLIERLPIVEARLAEILLLWSAKNEDETPRTREQTQAKAAELAAALDAGASFTQLASEPREDP